MSWTAMRRFGDISSKDMYQIPDNQVCKYTHLTPYMRFDVQSFLYGFKKKFGKEVNLKFFYMGNRQDFEDQCGSISLKFSKLHPNWKVKRVVDVKKSSLDVATEFYKYGVSKSSGSPPLSLCKQTFIEVDDGDMKLAIPSYKKYFPTTCKEIVSSSGIPPVSLFINQFVNIDTGGHLFLLHDENNGIVVQDLYRFGAYSNPHISECVKDLKDFANKTNVSQPVKNLGNLSILQGIAQLWGDKYMYQNPDNQVCLGSNFLVTSCNNFPIALLRIIHMDNYDSNSREGRRQSEENSLTQYSIFTSKISSETDLRNTRDTSNYANDFSTFFKKIKFKELDGIDSFMSQYIRSASTGFKVNKLTDAMSTKDIFEPDEDAYKEGSKYKRRFEDKEDITIESYTRDSSGLSLCDGHDSKRTSRWLILKLLIDNMTDKMKKSVNTKNFNLVEEFINKQSFESNYTNKKVSLNYDTSVVLENLFGSDLIKYMFDDALPNYLRLEEENNRIRDSFDNYIAILPYGKNGCYGFMYMESYKVNVLDDSVPKERYHIGNNRCLQIFQSDYDRVHLDKQYGQPTWLNGHHRNLVDISGVNIFMHHRPEPRIYILKFLKDINGFDKSLFSEQFKNLTFARIENEFDRDGFVSYSFLDGAKRYRTNGRYHGKEDMCNYIPESDMVLFHSYVNQVYSNDWIIHPTQDNVLDTRFPKKDGLHWITSLRYDGGRINIDEHPDLFRRQTFREEHPDGLLPEEKGGAS